MEHEELKYLLMSDFILYDCQFDKVAEKLKHHKIWGAYSKEVRVCVQDGIVFVTNTNKSKNEPRMLHNKHYSFTRHRDKCCFVVSCPSSSVVYKFPDADTTAQFFQSISHANQKGKYYFAVLKAKSLPVQPHLLLTHYQVAKTFMIGSYLSFHQSVVP